MSLGCMPYWDCRKARVSLVILRQLQPTSEQPTRA